MLAMYSCHNANFQFSKAIGPDIFLSPLIFTVGLTFLVSPVIFHQVSCLMDSNPASGLTFKWKFNTTANTVDIPVSPI